MTFEEYLESRELSFRTVSLYSSYVNAFLKNYGVEAVGDPASVEAYLKKRSLSSHGGRKSALKQLADYIDCHGVELLKKQKSSVNVDLDKFAFWLRKSRGLSPGSVATYLNVVRPVIDGSVSFEEREKSLSMGRAATLRVAWTHWQVFMGARGLGVPENVSRIIATLLRGSLGRQITQLTWAHVDFRPNEARVLSLDGRSVYRYINGAALDDLLALHAWAAPQVPSDPLVPEKPGSAIPMVFNDVLRHRAKEVSTVTEKSSSSGTTLAEEGWGFGDVEGAEEEFATAGFFAVDAVDLGPPTEEELRAAEFKDFERAARRGVKR